MDASSIFQSYSSGVITTSKCGTRLNHAVQLVGYNHEQQYWIVRNSWGAGWGADGFINIKFGSNICGVEAEAAATHVKKLQPHSPPSPGLPPSSPPSPPAPPATPPPPIHPGGPIPDSIGAVGVDELAPLKLDGTTNALSVRLNETVGGDKPGLTVAMFVRRANLRNKDDVLFKIGSVRASFNHGMTLSTSTKSMSELEGEQAAKLAAETDPMTYASASVLKTEDNDACVSKRNNGQLNMEACQASASSSNTNQKFYWDGNQTIRVADSQGKCWQHMADSTPAYVYVADCDDTNPRQQWYWDDTRLKSRHDGKCVTNEGYGYYSSCNYWNCKLLVSECAVSPAPIVPQQWFFDNRKACRVRSGWCTGTRKQGLDCDADNVPDPACNAGGGYFGFVVRDPFTGLCVDNSASGVANQQDFCSAASPVVGLAVKNNEVFPGLVWTQVVISLSRQSDTKAMASIYWDNVLKKQGEVDLPPPADMLDVGWSSVSIAQGTDFRGEIKNLYVVNREINAQTRGLLHTLFLGWQACNPMSPSLRPYVAKPASLCLLSCNPACTGLQPYVILGWQASYTPVADNIKCEGDSAKCACAAPAAAGRRLAYEEKAPSKASKGQEALVGKARSTVSDSYVDAIATGGVASPLGVVGGSLIELHGYFYGAPFWPMAVTVGSTPCEIVSGDSSETSVTCKLGAVSLTTAERDGPDVFSRTVTATCP